MYSSAGDRGSLALLAGSMLIISRATRNTKSSSWLHWSCVCQMGLSHVEVEVIHYFTSVQRKRERFSFNRDDSLSSMKVVAIASRHILCSHRESRNIIYSANSF